MSEERNWQEEFEDIIDDPEQNPIVVYSEADEDAQLGPAIAEGATLEEAIERYQALKRDMDEMED